MKDRVREIFLYWFVLHMPETRGLGKLKSGTQMFIMISSMGDKDPCTQAIFHCLSRMHKEEAGPEMEIMLIPTRNVGIPSRNLIHKTTMPKPEHNISVVSEILMIMRIMKSFELEKWGRLEESVN